jgi:hypothetical protein
MIRHCSDMVTLTLPLFDRIWNKKQSRTPFSWKTSTTCALVSMAPVIRRGTFLRQRAILSPTSSTTLETSAAVPRSTFTCTDLVLVYENADVFVSEEGATYRMGTQNRGWKCSSQLHRRPTLAEEPGEWATQVIKAIITKKIRKFVLTWLLWGTIVMTY